MPSPEKNIISDHLRGDIIATLCFIKTGKGVEGIFVLNSGLEDYFSGLSFLECLFGYFVTFSCIYAHFSNILKRLTIL